MPLTVDPTLGPGVALSDTLIGLLRDDGLLGSYLFPSWSPSVDPADERVYRSSAELPRNEAIRSALPRILVEIRLDPRDDEQPGVEATWARARVYLYVTVPAEHELAGLRIVQRIRAILASTPPSGARIIAAGLVPTNLERRDRESALNNAWRFTIEYRSPSVGVVP